MTDAETAELDRPHPYVPSQLARARRCAQCGRPQHAAVHIVPVAGRCPTCGRPLDLLDRCPAGCLDHLDADPDHRDRPTSRDRFGSRNR